MESRAASSVYGRGYWEGLRDLPKATWVAGGGPVSGHGDQAASECLLPEEGDIC